MKLDGLVFEDFFLSPFVDNIVRALASVSPHIFDVVIMSVVVEGDIFEVIGRGCTKNWIVLCDSHQDWFYMVAM